MMEADWTDLKVKYLDRAQPKYKRVDLENKIETHPESEWDVVFTRGYNMAIDNIKSKYGDLYVEVK